MSLSVNIKQTLFTSPLYMYLDCAGRPFSLHNSGHFFLKRHPHAPNNFKKKASYTVEAAVIVPIFLYVCVSILMFFGVLENEWTTKVRLSDSVRKAAIYGSVLPEEFSMDARLLTVDEKDVALSSVKPVKMPLDFFGLGGMVVTERAKAHRWVGYDPKEGLTDENNIVYVTESGKAYHKSLECTYLNPSISSASRDELSGKRNTVGGKYYACPLCKGSSTVYYITNYGNRYHTTLSCSGLKRTIKSETVEQALKDGYHSCSKCAKGE